MANPMHVNIILKELRKLTENKMECSKCGLTFDKEKEFKEHEKLCGERICKNPYCQERRWESNCGDYCIKCLMHPCKHCGSFCTDKIIIRYDQFSVQGDCCTGSSTRDFRVCTTCGRITLPERG